MSIFLSNPKYVDEITNAKIVQNDQIIKTVSLHKNGESSYSSEPFVVPSGQFTIFIEGWDFNGSPILREIIVDIIPDQDKPINPDEKEMQDLLESFDFKFIFQKFKGLIVF